MRLICWTSVLVSLVGLVAPAAGFEPDAGHFAASGIGQWNAYCAPACGAPAYGTVVGCCEYSPLYGDNAWAGYCQERARRRAFWENLFDDKHSTCRPSGGVCSPAAQYGPTPAEAAMPLTPSTPADPVVPSQPGMPIEVPPTGVTPGALEPIPAPVESIEPVEPVIESTTWRRRLPWQR